MDLPARFEIGPRNGWKESRAGAVMSAGLIQHGRVAYGAGVECLLGGRVNIY